MTVEQPTPAAPGVLRRRWTLSLTHLRMLEAWQGAVALHNGALIPLPVPALRLQVLAEFPARASRLAR